jgi:hypothetical protein
LSIINQQAVLASKEGSAVFCQQIPQMLRLQHFQEKFKQMLVGAGLLKMMRHSIILVTMCFTKNEINTILLFWQL